LRITTSNAIVRHYAAMAGRFTGRTALVTGAGGGIGRATSRTLASEGAHVICADVDEDARSTTVATIAADGGHAEGVPCDVTNPDDCVRAVEVAVIGGRRHLDVLVNVAGVGGFAPTTDVALDEWNHTLAVNLTGTFLMCQRALPALVEARGCIVNVASVAGIRAVPYNAAYCASKAGVVMLTKSIAVEYGRRDVRANCVCPSSVDTPFLDGFAFTDEMDMSLFARGSAVLAGAMDPRVVADAIAYLASDAAAMITGSTLMLDGGATA
jgi:NAD(P)-dependent dehydrogenase (short-subunit alcohol dehydrogenase family)